MAAVVAALAPPPDLVLCSTATRARQTLARAVPVTPGRPVRLERALYTFNAGDLLAVLRTLDDAAGAVLVIGHNPALEELTHRLARADDSDPEALARLRTKYSTAALATLHLASGLGWADLGADSAALAAFTRPRDLA
jgi:phosphohistidine phosphatase